ncbi:helicase RepA family protein [Falsirhodobacter xinxiangensis]|uniref:helicase RepA family protein n=1 Tax=Falsirhodobacter xinxiangensis TaxID=2530049 RepID=UPI00145C1632|nr:helicase RepA family protein [Rhodobacter xinxiangensis]
MNAYDPFYALPTADDVPEERVETTTATVQVPCVPAFRFIPVDELKYRPPEFLVSGLIETEGLGLIFGDPGCGKSFLAVDLGLSVATGTPFHGREVKKGPVLLIAGEGHNGLTRRFHAWAKDRGQSLADARLFTSERAAQFLDKASANTVAAAVDAIARVHGQPSLIIVDTVARNFGAGDENSTQDMSGFIVAMDDLKARYPGCVLMLVHHSGHGDKGRARGAMALKGALDFEFRVERDGARVRVVNTKMKDAEPPADLHFTLEGVELEADAKSAVLRAGDAPGRQTRLTSPMKLAISTYENAAREHGIWEDDGRTFRGVHVDHWRGAFYPKHTGDSIDTKRKAFQRVRSDLVSAGLMAVQDDVYLVRISEIQTAIFTAGEPRRDKRDKAGQVPDCPEAEVEYSGTSGTNA